MIIFMGIFYTVVAIVLVTLTIALYRGMRDLHRRLEVIQWHSDFEDLSTGERRCRHDFTGELAGRVCPNAFECQNCELHAKVAQAHPHEMAQIVDDSLGVPVPLDRYYHRGHTWVKPESDGTYTIGLDPLAERLAAHPTRLELPVPGARIARNGIAWRMWAHGAEFRVRAPIDGEVVDTEPEGEWRIRVKPTGKFTLAYLLRGGEAVRWLGREFDRVHLMVSAAEAVPSLADGGVPVDDFAAACPKANWPAICGILLLDK